MDFSKISNIQFENIDYSDAPDFCDCYIISADYGFREATEAELEEINENRDFVHEELLNYLY
jgi:hypothetical protein